MTWTPRAILNLEEIALATAAGESHGTVNGYRTRAAGSSSSRPTWTNDDVNKEPGISSLNDTRRLAHEAERHKQAQKQMR
ncbi:hypothetical protein VCV18_006124 [Metarhizium anisopliae]